MRTNEKSSYEHRQTLAVLKDDQHASQSETRSYYDADDGVVKRRITTAAVTDTEVCAYDGAHVALALSAGHVDPDPTVGGSNTPDAPPVYSRYMWGPGTDQLIAEDTAQTTHWFLSDAQGSVRTVLNASGSAIETVDYDAYGNVTSGSGAQHLHVSAPDSTASSITPGYSQQFDVPVPASATGRRLWLDNFSSDDLTALMSPQESITTSFDSGNNRWVVQVPADAILFPNTTEHWGTGATGTDVRITDGTHAFTITGNTSLNGMASAGFTMRDAGSGATAQELRDRGWVNADGVAAVKFGVVGDAGTHADAQVRPVRGSSQRFLYTRQEWDAATDAYSLKQ